MKNSYLQARLAEYPDEAEIMMALHPIEGHLYSIGPADNVEFIPPLKGVESLGTIFLSGSQRK